MTKEAKITIDGVELSQWESRAIRHAVEKMHKDLEEPAFRNDIGVIGVLHYTSLIKVKNLIAEGSEEVLRKTPAQWLEGGTLRITDPVGWHKAKVAFDEPITYGRFRELSAQSTTEYVAETHEFARVGRR